MKAAIKAGKELFKVIDVPIPEIGKGDCLIKVSYCATCAWCYEEWLRDGNDDIFGPGITGHEMSGIIVKTGENVKDFKVGDEVLTYVVAYCGKCPECLGGKETYCRNRGRVINGYAEYISVPQQSILPSPRGIDLKHAGLIADMVGTSMHAIRRAFSVNLKRNVVAIWGLGPVGMMAVQGVRTFEGVEKVIAVDPVKYRRDLALELGADIALDPADPSIEELLLKENGGRGVNYAFNCAIRKPEALETAFKTLKVDGYLMNITGRALSGSQTEKRVDGSYYFFKNEYEENVRLVQEGKIKLEPIMTHEFPLDSINEAMELRSKHPDKAIKVTIKCS